MTADARPPIREALEQVERVLRSYSGTTINECADVIRRVLDGEWPSDIEVVGSGDGRPFVIVPVAELEALRSMRQVAADDEYVTVERRPLNTLVARIPEPPPWEPSDELVRRYREARGWGVADISDDDFRADRKALRDLHRAGLLREDSDRE